MTTSYDLQGIIFFASLPPQESLAQFSIGIDLNFFNFDQVTASSGVNLKGIKLISPGLHLFHFYSLNLQIRCAFFIDVQKNYKYLLEWDQENELFNVYVLDQGLKLVVTGSDKQHKRQLEQSDHIDECSLNISKWTADIYESIPFMINYSTLNQQNGYLNKDWPALVSHISMNLVNKIYPRYRTDLFSDTITSFDASRQENENLLNQLHKKFASQGKTEEQIEGEPLMKSLKTEQYKELKYTIIDLKRTVVTTDATPQQITEQSMDKSKYLLDEVLSHKTNDRNFIGEFQICFVNMIILFNYNSAEQWMNMVQLVLMSFKAIQIRTDFFIEFLTMFDLMLKNLPDNFIKDDASLDDGGIVKLHDINFLKALKNFQVYLFYDLPTNDKLKTLQRITLSIFEEFKTKFGMLISLEDTQEQDEKGEEIDDEDDEYKPVVVTI